MKKNDIVALFRYAKVKAVFSPNHILVTDLETGNDFEINGKELVDDLFNATEVKETKVVSRTEAETQLVNVGHQPITVCFTKQGGDERVMKCKRVGDAHFGRSLVFDFDSGSMKQVDHRTLKWLVVNGVKYRVK